MRHKSWTTVRFMFPALFSVLTVSPLCVRSIVVFIHDFVLFAYERNAGLRFYDKIGTDGMLP